MSATMILFAIPAGAALLGALFRAFGYGRRIGKRGGDGGGGDPKMRIEVEFTVEDDSEEDGGDV